MSMWHPPTPHEQRYAGAYRPQPSATPPDWTQRIGGVDDFQLIKSE